MVYVVEQRHLQRMMEEVVVDKSLESDSETEIEDHVVFTQLLGVLREV